MKKLILILALAVLGLQNVNAQFTINSETVYNDNSGSAGTLYTLGNLAPCTNYFLKYNLTASTTISNLVINLPCGIVYNSTYNSTGGLTYITGSTNPAFTCSISGNVTVYIPVTSPCYGGTTALTSILYNNSNTVNSSTSLAVNGGNLSVTLYSPTALQISTGETKEWIIDLYNSGGGNITNASLDLSSQTSIVKLNGYVENSSSASLTLDAGCPSGFLGCSGTALSGVNIISSISVPANSHTYIHICIEGKCTLLPSGTAPDFSYSFNGCSGSVCQSGQVSSNINYNINGTPAITVTNILSSPNGAYNGCSSSGNNPSTATLYFEYKNTGLSTLYNSTTGHSKMTKLRWEKLVCLLSLPCLEKL